MLYVYASGLMRTSCHVINWVLHPLTTGNQGTMKNVYGACLLANLEVSAENEKEEKRPRQDDNEPLIPIIFLPRMGIVPPQAP
eukprot:5962049-Amphidinium_carterae.1